MIIIRRKLFSTTPKDVLMGVAGLDVLLAIPFVVKSLVGGVAAIGGYLKNPQKDIPKLKNAINYMKTNIEKLEKAKKAGKAKYDSISKDWICKEVDPKYGLESYKKLLKLSEEYLDKIENNPSKVRKENAIKGYKKWKDKVNFAYIPGIGSFGSVKL